MEEFEAEEKALVGLDLVAEEYWEEVCWVVVKVLVAKDSVEVEMKEDLEGARKEEAMEEEAQQLT